MTTTWRELLEVQIAILEQLCLHSGADALVCTACYQETCDCMAAKWPLEHVLFKLKLELYGAS